jgi:cellulose synthase/poly-beta-1,6-N-acetylglucosamine synthase-like glycosyltransferase
MLARFSVLAAYFGCLLALTLYAVHRLVLVALYLRHRSHPPTAPGRYAPAGLPLITVQLPLYNEPQVGMRLIEAAARLDYPQDRLEIQVLDDSTDETMAIAAAATRRLSRRGVPIVHVRRPDRTGFKAGALAAGLGLARGELIAIFDADFVPRREFLLELVHHFTDPRVGMVQARWGHLNRAHSALTEAQALLLDGHFVIEHTARNRSGRCFNFNGTAGIWRRSAIEDAGGWQPDTLTEDLDLSYRAQLRGWRFVYRLDEVAPAELPVEMSAFKSQQHRWAKGSIETALKLLPAILQSRLPLAVKLEAAAHLTANVGYVLTVGLALLAVPAAWARSGIAARTFVWVDWPALALSAAATALFYLVSRREARGTWGGALRVLPGLIAVGIGLSINNARAVLEATAGRRTAFRRTPKYDLAPGERPGRRHERAGVPAETWVELVLAAYFGVAVTWACAGGQWRALPCFVLFFCGYGVTALWTLVQVRSRASADDAQLLDPQHLAAAVAGVVPAE